MLQVESTAPLFQGTLTNINARKAAQVKLVGVYPNQTTNLLLMAEGSTPITVQFTDGTQTLLFGSQNNVAAPLWRVRLLLSHLC